MKTYARIQDGVVAELFPTDGDIKTMFHPSLVWIDVTGLTPAPQERWTYNGTAFAPPAPTPPQPPPKPSPRAWLERLAADRQQAIVDACFAGGGQARLWILKACGSPEIDVTDPETKTGLGVLLADGIITPTEQQTLLTP